MRAERARAQGKLERALRDYEQAWRLDPTPRLAYRRAQVYEALGRLPEAIALYQEYLTLVPDSPYAEAIRAHMRTLGLGAEPLAPRVLRLTVIPPEASVVLGERPLQRKPVYEITFEGSAPVALRAWAPGHQPVEVRLEPPEQGAAERTLRLRPLPEESVAPPEAPEVEQEVDPPTELMLVELGPPGWARNLGWGLVATGTFMTALGFWSVATEDPPSSRLLNTFLVLGPTFLGASAYLLWVRDWEPSEPRPAPRMGLRAGGVWGAGVRLEF